MFDLVDMVKDLFSGSREGENYLFFSSHLATD